MSLRYNIITALESTKEMDYMRIMLGDKIKELRKRDHRTQDDLASALGITNQAVSRWEMNKAYPDVEIIPAIANYFHVSIDELFGYSNDRERTLSSYIEKANALLKPGITPDKRMLKESILFLREALSEFPNEWNLQERLATFLWIKNSNDRKESNDAALKEVVELFEMAYKNSDDFERKDSILASLIMVLGDLGDYQKIEEMLRKLAAYAKQLENDVLYFNKALKEPIHPNHMEFTVPECVAKWQGFISSDLYKHEFGENLINDIKANVAPKAYDALEESFKKMLDKDKALDVIGILRELNIDDKTGVPEGLFVQENIVVTLDEKIRQWESLAMYLRNFFSTDYNENKRIEMAKVIN